MNRTNSKNKLLFVADLRSEDERQHMLKHM